MHNVSVKTTVATNHVIPLLPCTFLCKRLWSRISRAGWLAGWLAGVGADGRGGLRLAWGWTHVKQFSGPANLSLACMPTPLARAVCTGYDAEILVATYAYVCQASLAIGTDTLRQLPAFQACQFNSPVLTTALESWPSTLCDHADGHHAQVPWMPRISALHVCACERATPCRPTKL
jgi:hypothetical protein